MRQIGLQQLDGFLNSITMYRLILYYLILLVLAAYFLSLLKLLPFSAIDLIYSTITLVLLCWITNTVFASTFKVMANVESFFITALILVLIITPPKPFTSLLFLFWVAMLSMASKYILAIKRKHIFNPAALAVFLTTLAINQSASWWVGNLAMLPFVLCGGLLVVGKLRRFKMVASFLIISLLTIAIFGFARGANLAVLLEEIIFYSPILFFAFVMLTEPLTIPPTQKLRVIYAALVGFFFAPQIHFGSFYSTPEFALVLGNIYSYIVSPKYRLVLKLKEKMQIAKDTYNFTFVPKNKLSFLPGQYMEWTLAHRNPDSRGNRRYFTIASSPAEEEINIGVKFYETCSSFKKRMISMEKGDEIVTSQLAGDFTLPQDPSKKLVLMAGGIGITPFRSMIKYLLDTNQKRVVTLIYSNKFIEDISYREFFDQAQKDLGLRVVYTLTDLASVPANWDGLRGYIDEEVIKREVSDFLERIFYISGSHSMVVAFEDVLMKIGVPARQIKTDFFPGYT